MTSAEYLMGVDLGTSSVKTVIIDLSGRPISTASQEYPLLTPQPGWVEQDPEIWVQAAENTMKLALQRAGIPGNQIAGIGLAGQMHGLVCLGKEGKVLRPSIIWADHRSREQVERVYTQIGRDRLGLWTANPLDTGFMLASWLWLLDNEPGVTEKTALLLLPKDYLRCVLTGEIGSEPSDAASTLMFDTVNRRWSSDLLEKLAIDPQILPPVHESSDIAGGLRKSPAKRIGLKENTPVVYGGSDQALQAVGHHILDPGTASSTIGTGGQLFAPISQPIYDKQLRLHTFCHVIPDLWHLEAAILSAGLSLKWLRDNVLGGVSYQQLADMAAKVSPGAEGLYFVPHLIGERTPHMDPDAKAAFIGFNVRHSQAHLARAVMEGVVMEMRIGLEIMIDMGCPFDRLVASGGGTKHQLWLQLQSDILNCPIYQTKTVEASAIGAALLAGVGVGAYPDIHTACEQTIQWKNEVVTPIEENVKRYDEVFGTFMEIYPVLKSLG